MNEWDVKDYEALQELCKVLNTVMMEDSDRRVDFWGRDMRETLPPYIRGLRQRIAVLEAERDAAQQEASRLRGVLGRLLAGIEAYDGLDIERLHLYGPSAAWLKSAIQEARDELKPLPFEANTMSDHAPEME